MKKILKISEYFRTSIKISWIQASSAKNKVNLVEAVSAKAKHGKTYLIIQRRGNRSLSKSLVPTLKTLSIKMITRAYMKQFNFKKAMALGVVQVLKNRMRLQFKEYVNRKIFQPSAYIQKQRLTEATTSSQPQVK